MIRAVLLAIALGLALGGCGYAIKWGAPVWWTDGSPAGPDGVKRQPLIRR